LECPQGGDFWSNFWQASLRDIKGKRQVHGCLNGTFCRDASCSGSTPSPPPRTLCLKCNSCSGTPISSSQSSAFCVSSASTKWCYLQTRPTLPDWFNDLTEFNRTMLCNHSAVSLLVHSPIPSQPISSIA
jgi:hypothetical protein